MAVRHGYGKIAGTDALVFAYDTGDTVNSYKGRPTTNYGPVDFADWTPEAGTAGDTAERIPTGNYYKGQPTYNCRTDTTQLYRGIYSIITDLSTIAGAGGTVTVSCMIRNNNSSTDQYINVFIGHDFSSVRSIAANSDWQKVQWTVDAANMNNNYVEFRPVTRVTDEYLEMTMPMVEVNVTYASQFVNGTRSATEGLKDLTGNTSIDLTDVSFDSNAQIAFDGTDDMLTHDATQFLSGSSYTLSQWQQLDANANTAWQAFCGDDRFVVGGSVNNGGYYMWHSNGRFWWYQSFDNPTYYGVISQTLSGGNIFDRMVGESPFSVDVTFKGSTNTMKIYINGELEATATPTWAPGLDRITFDKIGGSNNRRFTGNIPTQKLYNRALTADEVRSNYRHYKNRFNI
jgi:hypothetical protein